MVIQNCMNGNKKMTMTCSKSLNNDEMLCFNKKYVVIIFSNNKVKTLEVQNISMV